MEIHGFQKTTLLDFPGKVAASVFTGGCNFRCPFCQNGDLAAHPGRIPGIPGQEVLDHLRKRRNVLDGVCVTGGEPTLQPDLREFMEKVKELGLLVKLDTNGYLPDVLMELCRAGLVDFVAMDIKGAPGQYARIAGAKIWDSSRIQTSVDFLMSGEIPYEFRTTVVRELHTKEDMLLTADWIAGAKAYFLQSYQDSEQVLQPGLHGYQPEELKELCRIIQKKIPNTQVRGVD